MKRTPRAKVAVVSAGTGAAPAAEVNAAKVVADLLRLEREIRDNRAYYAAACTPWDRAELGLKLAVLHRRAEGFYLALHGSEGGAK